MAIGSLVKVELLSSLEIIVADVDVGRRRTVRILQHGHTQYGASINECSNVVLELGAWYCCSILLWRATYKLSPVELVVRVVGSSDPFARDGPRLTNVVRANEEGNPRRLARLIARLGIVLDRDDGGWTLAPRDIEHVAASEAPRATEVLRKVQLGVAVADGRSARVGIEHQGPLGVGGMRKHQCDPRAVGVVLRLEEIVVDRELAIVMYAHGPQLAISTKEPDLVQTRTDE